MFLAYIWTTCYNIRLLKFIKDDEWRTRVKNTKKQLKFEKKKISQSVNRNFEMDKKLEGFKRRMDISLKEVSFDDDAEAL